MDIIHTGSIYKKLIEVSKEIQRVPKNGYNSFHKYNYVMEADLVEQVREIFSNHNIAFTVTCLKTEVEGEFRRVLLKFALIDTDDGSVVESEMWGEGQDKGDKGFYKAFTGAVKYFLMKMFLIPSGDDPEQDEKSAKKEETEDTKLFKQIGSLMSSLKANTKEQKDSLIKASGLPDTPNDWTLLQKKKFVEFLKDQLG